MSKQEKKSLTGTKRMSYASRGFAHFMDYSGVHTGTWIMGVMYLESCPPDEIVHKIVEERLLSMSRFKSEMIVTKKSVGLKLLDDIDWNYHLVKAFENEVVSEDDLADYAGNIIERLGFSAEKPHWRMVLVPKLENGQSAVILCFNHSIADGIAAIGVLLKVTDDSPIDPTLPMSQQAQGKHKSIVRKREKGPQLGVLSTVRSFFYGVYLGLSAGVGTPDPHNALKMKTDVFSKEYTAKKHLAQAEKISLEEIKLIKSKFEGATVNDILLALMTISVRNFLIEVDDPMVRKKIKNNLRGNFPVSMRRKDEALLEGGNPKNRWNPVAFRFPLNYKDGVDCVWQVKNIVDRLKVSPQLPIQDRLARFLMSLPRHIALPILLNLNAKVSLMLSNVPGPMEKLHFAGIGIEDMNFFLIAPVGSYLGVLTYNGNVSMSVNFDASMNQDPKLLAKHWKSAFEQLKVEVERFPGSIPSSSRARKKLLKNLGEVSKQKDGVVKNI